MADIQGDTTVFVKIEDYKDVVDVMELIKAKINEAKATLGRVNELKNEEDSEMELWNTTLNDIERRIDFIDKSLFEPENL